MTGTDTDLREQNVPNVTKFFVQINKTVVCRYVERGSIPETLIFPRMNPWQMPVNQ